MRERFPLGVIVVGLISLVRSLSLAAGLFAFSREGIVGWLAENGPIPTGRAGADAEIVVRALLAGLLIASVLTIVGLVFRRGWAWVLAIVSAGAILAIDIGWWFAGEPRPVSMLLNSIAVFYLNQRDVRVALRGTSDE